MTRCNVDLQTNDGATALQLAEHRGHAGIATLIRNKKHQLAGTLVQASPAHTKKQEEDADRAMKELLEEEDKDAAASAAVSQKKKQAKKAGKERRRDAADGPDGSQKDEHAEEQKDTERTEAKAVSDSEKNKTESVAAVAVVAALAEEEEEVRRQEAAERPERRRKEEERQKEETDFMRAWREPISLLENAQGKVGARRPWMQGIRESKYDFSTMEQDDEDYSEVVVLQEQVLSTDFAALSLDNGVALDGIVRGGTLEADAAREVHVERNMEQEAVEDSLPGDMSDEQWLGANSDHDSDNVTLWYTDQVRKWYRNAVQSLKSQQYAPTRMYTRTHTHTRTNGM